MVQWSDQPSSFPDTWGLELFMADGQGLRHPEHGSQTVRAFSWVEGHSLGFKVIPLIKAAYPSQSSVLLLLFDSVIIIR